MKKIGLIEVLGITGLAFWGIILIFRKSGQFSFSELNLFSLMMWTAPNFGGAWFFTASLKQFIKPVFAEHPVIKKDFTRKIYFSICSLIFIIAVILEYLNPYLLGGTSGFDIFDVLATFIAQTVIFVLPIIFQPDIFQV